MARGWGVGVDLAVPGGLSDLPQHAVEPQFLAVEEGDVALGDAQRVKISDHPERTRDFASAGRSARIRGPADHYSDRMTSITDPEVNAFLTEGTRTGVLGFTSADGRPLVTPVWFIVEDGCIVFNTGKETAKGRALARDPRAALCVDLEEPPYAFVQVQGSAELSEDPAELLRTAIAIAARYMGADRAEEFGKRNAVPGELVVRLRPTKVIAALNVTA